MKLLKNKVNVDGVSSAYPYGRVRDRGISVQGTPANTEMFSDYVQFFEKMFAESGLTPTGLPDNNTNGFQLWEAAKLAIKGYKVYVALISQSGTSNPTVTVLKNEFPASITWVRTALGEYTGTIPVAPMFTLNKTVTIIGNTTDSTSSHIVNTSTSQNIIATWDENNIPKDSILNKTYVEIRVYN